MKTTSKIPDLNLSGDTFVMDFTKPGDPEIYFKKNEVSDNQILLCSGLKDCIMIEKKVL